jgi:hypothetical protein
VGFSAFRLSSGAQVVFSSPLFAPSVNTYQRRARAAGRLFGVVGLQALFAGRRRIPGREWTEGGAKPLTCHARSLSARFVSAEGNYRAKAALAFVQLKGRRTEHLRARAPRTCSTLSHSLNPCVFFSLGVHSCLFIQQSYGPL